MNIDIEKINDLVQESDKILLSVDGEETLLKLLDIQEQVEQAISDAKTRIQESALKIDPNFSSVQGSRIKVYYRSFGQRYYVDETNVSSAPRELYTAEQKTTFKVDSDKVGEWVEKNGRMPDGIIEVKREKVISIQKKK